jgi:[ribosomal protein S18]-alanine N-acetyltransferase
VEVRPYADTDRQRLIEVLRTNVPKYFSETDVLDFERYLRDRLWARHYVYLGSDRRVVGCASCYAKSPNVVGLSWMFFECLHVGPSALRRLLGEYFARVAQELCPGEDVTLALNTTPRTAKFMRRLGFSAVATIKNGYGPGYDKVSMERRGSGSGCPQSASIKE